MFCGSRSAVLGGGDVLVVRHRRRTQAAARRAACEPRLSPTTLAASIGDAIDDLEAEPDARRAVIAAYARMESSLARNGLQRVPSETPLEYLRRILLGLTSRGDAVSRLTGLFEQAKFSRHEIDATMKQAAIGALREIRDDLREPRREAPSARPRASCSSSSTIASAYVLRPARLRDIASHVYVLVVGALVMLGVVAAAGDAVPRRPPFAVRRALAEAAGAGPAPSRARADRARGDAGGRDASTSTSASLPHLREIARAASSARGKTSAPRRWAAGGNCCGPTARRPHDRFAAGISRAELRALVADLERL